MIQNDQSFGHQTLEKNFDRQLIQYPWSAGCNENSGENSADENRPQLIQSLWRHLNRAHLTDC